MLLQALRAEITFDVTLFIFRRLAPKSHSMRHSKAGGVSPPLSCDRLHLLARRADIALAAMILLFIRRCSAAATFRIRWCSVPTPHLQYLSQVPPSLLLTRPSAIDLSRVVHPAGRGLRAGHIGGRFGEVQCLLLLPLLSEPSINTP